MSNDFPPSSPISSSQQVGFGTAAQNTISPDSSLYSLKPTKLAFGQTNTVSHSGNYPTPFPSSSAGRYSSPTKAVIPSDPTSEGNIDSSFNEEEYPPVSTDKVDPNEQLGPISPIVRHSSPSKEVHQKKDHAKYKVFPRVINIEIDPQSAAELVIGRKKDMCDFLLPGMRTISRRHALISYIPDRNQIRLKCIGINGIVVSLPRKLNCFLVRPTQDKTVFELTGIETIRMRQQFQQVDVNVNKELVKSNNITAFSVEPGETIIMPFMNNTMINFKQVKARLSMREVQTTFSFTERNPPSLMHKVKKDTLSRVRKQQPTTTPNDIITPVSSFAVREPLTPNKTASNTKQSIIAGKDEKIAVNLTNALSDVSVTKNNTNVSTSQTGTKRKLGTGHSHQTTHTKRAKHEPSKTKEELFADLADKNVDIEELQNILANHLAFLNVQQCPLSQLKESNSRTKTLTNAELRAILSDKKCIGVIARQGKDAAGKPLQEEYFYDMENDDDEQRKALVTSMKGGRTGLRSCRRTHKQYFWKRPAK
ncbi:Tos4 protein [Maudiozyma humilis]|uniref:Tos4 protein n=1 Tax=Maudiozyma humilis TaxID=51915 RepID=A0AAV5RZ03_MAUHU|nr:Tos4 protein [Kazachstania humilis]